MIPRSATADVRKSATLYSNYKTALSAPNIVKMVQAFCTNITTIFLTVLSKRLQQLLTYYDYYLLRLVV